MIIKTFFASIMLVSLCSLTSCTPDEIDAFADGYRWGWENYSERERQIEDSIQNVIYEFEVAEDSINSVK